MTIARSLSLIVTIYVAIAAVLLGFVYMGVDVLAGARVYVTGESLWSKAQKDAVYYLSRYPDSGDPVYYQRYQESMQIPRGDRIFRLELLKDDPDLEVVREGFLQGRNHPDDFGAGVRLFRRFGKSEHMARAIEIWEEGDRLLEEIDQQATLLHHEMIGDSPDAQAVEQIERRILELNELLTPLEQEFSATLAAGARRAGTLVLGVITGVTVLLLVIGTWVSALLIGRVEASERRYGVVLDTANDAFFAVDDSSGRIIDANRKAEEITGRSKHDLVGFLAAELHPEEERDRWHTTMENLRAAGKTKIEDFVVLASDGARIPVEMSTGMVKTGGRREIHILLRDVRDKRLAEEEIFRRDQQIVALVESAPDIISHFDRDKRHTYVNPAVERVTGVSAEVFIGRNHRELGTPGHLVDFWQAAIDRVFETGEERTIEFSFPGVDGTQHFHSRLAPVKDRSGDVKSVLSIARDITPRVNAESQLRQSQALVEGVLESSLAGIMLFDCIRDQEGKVVDFECKLINRSAVGMLHLDRSKILGQTLLAIIPELESDEIIERCINVVESGKSATFEKKFSSKTIAGWYHILIVKHDDGVVVTLSDISRQKDSEVQVRKSRDRFESMVNSIDGIVWEADIETFQFTYVSKPAEPMLGYPVDQWLNEHDFWPNHMHPDDREWAIDFCMRSMQKGKPYDFEYRMLASDGRTIWLRDMATLTRIGSKKILMGVMIDITDRKVAEQALKESEERHRIIAETATDGIVTIDDREIIQYVNPAVEAIFGYTAEEVISHPFSEVVPSFQHHLNRIRSNGSREKNGSRRSRLAFQLNGRHKTGQQIPLEIAVGSFERDGRQMFTAYIRDVTERKRSEEQLLASLREKEVLLKEVHHRVKNNLQVISSLLNLQTGQIKDPDDLSLFEDSQNRVRSMALIHEQLYQTDTVSTVDVSEYLRNLLSILIHTYRVEDVSTHIDADPVHLNLDTAIPCGLILNELISNALKYAFHKEPGEGGHILRVALEQQENNMLKLTVADNGIGFEFERELRNAKTLGVQLIALLSEQINGDLAVSIEGGTTFTVTFPSPQPITPSIS